LPPGFVTLFEYTIRITHIPEKYMARTEKVIVRLTKQEKEKIEKYSKYLGVSMSEIIQDYIKSLPNKDC
jgi:uncharacterized SAM-dependent methyltransferase